MSVPAPSARPLLETGEPIPGRPLLVSGPASAAILDASGEFFLQREARGGLEQWGGVYAQETRLTGPWQLRLHTEGADGTLPTTLVRLEHRRWGVVSTHRLGDLQLRQTVTAPVPGAGIARRLTVINGSPAACRLQIESRLEPFLAPVLLEGVKPPEYALTTVGPSVHARSHGFGFVIDTAPLPHHLFLDGRPWIGGRWKGPLRELAMDLELRLAPAGQATVDWFVWGGLERNIDATPGSGQTQLQAADAWADRARDDWEGWVAGTPRLDLPDAPQLQAGYDLARGALRQLFARAEPGMTGLVAGYPWYAALWCRDMAWMLPAVLWLGDHEWAREALRTVFRFQAPTDLAILGATRGELPMQASPGPIFLYGTSDTTLYYPGLVRRWLAHSQELPTLGEFVGPLQEIDLWAEHKVDPDSGLLRNGGEVSRMQQAAAGVGRVRYGIDAVDTTIWDSTDRRDHAVDVVALWASAAGQLAELYALSGAADAARRAQARHREVAGRLAHDFWWDEEGYLYDSLRRDLSPVEKIRPNALRAAALGLLPESQAARVVRRAAAPDLTTPWGLRTLSDHDPGYDPIAYHDGQVWPIATSWAADAALRCGQRELGLAYLQTLARALLTEFGYANECYRGDRPEPYDSCFLLGFSVAPFITLIFERLWGLSIGLDGRVGLDPAFPAEWSRASVHGLRIGRGRLDIAWQPGHADLAWSGPAPLAAGPADAPIRIPPGGHARLSLGVPGKA